MYYHFIINANVIAIKRAVTNMLVNALRYGNGWVKVSSGVIKDHAWFQVEDDGAGIKKESIQHLCFNLLCKVKGQEVMVVQD